MSQLIKRLNEKKLTENYNEENLEDLTKHIEEESKKPAKPIYRMVEKHTGPIKVIVTEASRKKCAEIILK